MRSPTARRVEADRNGFRIDGEPKLLRGGTVQWFRLPEQVWADRLDRFAAAGFNTIDAYVPWRDIEPVEGQFDEAFLDKLCRFLELAQEKGLLVYMRPGPYICNEYDGGGIPSWVRAKSDKAKKNEPGVINMRTDDQGWVDASSKYLSKLNARITPYLASNGGPIALYSIENEYDFFQMFHEIDKLGRIDGRAERPLLQFLKPGQYLRALRDTVRADGVDVPLTTCPGKLHLWGTGGVEDVIPMPNNYVSDRVEWRSLRLLDEMHGKAQHANQPSGVTEGNRSASAMKRSIMGGLDAYFAFNAAGILQDGFRNSVIVNPAAFEAKGLVRGLQEPEVGYFHNVIDFNGPIGPTGDLRENFYEFRRANMFLDAFEPRIAPLGKPRRSGATGPFGPHRDSTVRVDGGQIGAAERFGKVLYWHEGGDGERYVGLTNESDAPVTLPPKSIHVGDREFPRWTSMTVAADDCPIMVSGLPLTSSTKLGYTTSEILSERAHNGRKLLVLYGEGAGELTLDTNGRAKIVSADDGVQVRAHDEAQLAVTYDYEPDRRLTIDDGEQLVDVLITSRDRAGKLWFVEHEGRDIMVENAELVRKDGTELVIESTAPRADRAVPDVLQTGVLATGASEADIDHDTTGWTSFVGEPRHLETFGINEGHAWYRTELDLTAEDITKDASLKIDHASDFVGVYVNGDYITTQAPNGTEMELADLQAHVRPGKNVIAFRTEIWGHGSFMLPEGRIWPTKAALPAVGMDSMKGLSGAASLAGKSLDNWKVRAGLGEATESSASAAPTELAPGAVARYRVDFDAADVPDGSDGPISLRLEGKDTKATIRLNGDVVGRWLSDDEWLHRGTWADPTRTVWSNASPDDFPIPQERLQTGTNTIEITYEDASDGAGSTVAPPRFVYAEDKARTVRRVPL